MVLSLADRLLPLPRDDHEIAAWLRGWVAQCVFHTGLKEKRVAWPQVFLGFLEFHDEVAKGDDELLFRSNGKGWKHPGGNSRWKIVINEFNASATGGG